MTRENNGRKNQTNPAALRDKAQRLIEEAERLERDALVKIGKLTLKYHESDFSDMSKFRKELEALRG